jgi:hypothetical protein
MQQLRGLWGVLFAVVGVACELERAPRGGDGGDDANGDTSNDAPSSGVTTQTGDGLDETTQELLETVDDCLHWSKVERQEAEIQQEAQTEIAEQKGCSAELQELRLCHLDNGKCTQLPADEDGEQSGERVFETSKCDDEVEAYHACAD